MRPGFINGTGHVDICGLDAYPQRFNCSTPRTWSGITNDYHQYHEANNPSEPWFMPEFHGGASDLWGGPGYDSCGLLTGPDFEDVFYKHNWAVNVKMLACHEISFMLARFLQRFSNITLRQDAHPPAVPPPGVERSAYAVDGRERVWMRSPLTTYAKNGLWVEMGVAATVYPEDLGKLDLLSSLRACIM